MIMSARVIQVNPQSLLVINEETGEEVLVFFRNANRFSTGDRVRITYSGSSTFSIPPQITATAIERMQGITPPPSQSTPSEMRAVVLQRSRNSLLVRDARNRQYRVNYAYAHHFCVRQQVTIRYDTITLENPPRINATDIIPVC